MAIYNYITLSNSDESWVIAASWNNIPDGVTPRADMVITSVEGMLSIGEMSDSPAPRSYADGFVWDPAATRSGINMSIPITFYARSQSKLARDLISFRDFIYNSAEVTLVLPIPDGTRTYICQAQSSEPEDDHDGDAFSITLLLATRSAF